MIGARHVDFAHDIDHNRACLTNRDANGRTLIHGAYLLAKQTIGLCQSKSTDADRTILIYYDNTLGIDRQMKRNLRRTKNINNDFVARTDHVILWGRDVHVRLEG